MNETELKDMVRQNFDEASAGYDSPALRFFDLSAAHLIETLDLNGDESVLDLATGTGKVAIAAARRLPRGNVVGVDMSTGMLTQAAAKVRQQKLRNVVFECRDIET